jgi:hypothetical protein
MPSAACTAALSAVFAVFAINFTLIALRIMPSFFGGTIARIFSLEDFIREITSVISSSGSM